MALTGYNSGKYQVPRIIATAGETGGQWQIQDPHTGRVWSRHFNPYNTDYFHPILLEAYSVVVMLVFVRDDTIQIKGGMNSDTSFSPLPVSELGTKYIIASCLPPPDFMPPWSKRYRSGLMIATHSRTADIDIIFRLETNVTYNGRTYSNGDTLSVRLDKYQSFSLRSSSDMTRTVIYATESIAVYSGTYDGNAFRMIEQLLPVKHYGSEYVIAINDPSEIRRKSNRTLPYQLQVVTDRSDASIVFNDNSTISMSNDGLYRKQFGNVDTIFFSTTRPAMVTLCTAGTFFYNDGLTIVPPVSLYSKLTTQEAPGTLQIVTDQENSNVDVQQTREHLSTVFSPPIKWKNVSGTRFKVGTLSFDRYTTTIRSNISFAVLGYDVYIIYNGGYNFRTYPDTETSTPDGSGIKLNTGGSLQVDSPNNAAVIVGVVCGIVIVALLAAFVAYVFYTRRKMMSVTRSAEQGVDAPPSASMAIYAVPDRATEGAAAEGTYTGLRFKATQSAINIVESTAAYEHKSTE
ncbi:uncharacterized protein LOC124264986 [Haliotis rubra]|uniref:uncharacterized protein LOC124264986 n=1 Tax=Haliotis rubra TaxID=36100 RepID=UPI001EE56BB1|nr:uncharacterized protein LOC124264986 [Haliotis rubra]